MEAKRIEQRRRIVEVTPDMVRRRQAAERVIRATRLRVTIATRCLDRKILRAADEPPDETA